MDRMDLEVQAGLGHQQMPSKVGTMRYKVASVKTYHFGFVSNIQVKYYNYSCGGFASNTGHFTQVVWAETTHVGVSVSACGNYIFANYFPAGNMQGQFQNNVFPLGTKMIKKEYEDEDKDEDEDENKDDQEDSKERGNENDVLEKTASQDQDMAKRDIKKVIFVLFSCYFLYF